ncbi:MAG: hypothetical protein H7X88_01745 [Gloeobacteraceae cyanobacterium ES-bin-316]|nr:hypothetical protein [Ferruginibacter sp.]
MKNVTYSSFMLLKDVHQYLREEFIPCVFEQQLTLYINHENVGPFDQLTPSNVLVSSKSLNAFLGNDVHRNMECEVVTIVDEERYFIRLNSQSINSIKY